MNKNITLKHSLSILLFVLSGFTVFAQQPVQINTFLRAPYTLQLSDYYASTQEKLIVVLTNRDLNKPMLNVRLRMSIESQTVSLRSREFATLPILPLEAGVPLRLSLGDLAPYFNPDNLDFSGMTRAQYLQQAKLPDGFYTFCFEAIEVSTGQVASAKGCSMAWISLSDPPLLNIPQKGESVALKNPQNIIFQWTPRHLNSPNSAYATEYDFQLVELWDNSLAPEVAFQSMQPLYETTTRTTTLLYGPSQPLLMAGKRYGWRVRARARSGVDEVDIFRNQGYSEIYWFNYQDVCPAPRGVSDSTALFGSIKLSWLPDSRHTAYMVTYRQKNKEDATWFDQQAPTTSTIISDVQPGIEYEYRVAAFCNTDQPVYSDIHTVKAPSKETNTFANCSIVPDAQIKNKEELKTLKAGDEFKANDFPVKITELSGSSPYSGKGYIKIPFLGGLKVGATFENIKVNTEKQLIDGVVTTAYDENKTVTDADTVITKINDYLGIVSRLLESTVETSKEYLKDITDKAIEYAEKELPAEEVEIVRENTKELLEAKTEYDAAKSVYDSLPPDSPEKVIAENGVKKAETKFEAAKAQFSGADKNAITTEKYFVTFDKLASPATVNGFDKFIFGKFADDYERVERSSYFYIPWKAVPAGGYDWVAAVPMNSNESIPDSIFFRSSTGAIQAQKQTPTTIQLKVSGIGARQKSEIFAYQRKKINGKYVNIEVGNLICMSYTRQYRKLVVVEVNNKKSPYTKANLQIEMNKIYSQAVVQWTVEIQQLNSAYDKNNNGMQDNYSETVLYTDEMKTVLSDYSKKFGFKNDTQYLFLVAQRESGKEGGYNPYGRQAGFIFMGRTFPDQRYLYPFMVTLAHEIGHGAFSLNHTFYSPDRKRPAIPQGTTTNLMDYTVDKIDLFKYQWDLIDKSSAVKAVFAN